MEIIHFDARSCGGASINLNTGRNEGQLLVHKSQIGVTYWLDKNERCGA